MIVIPLWSAEGLCLIALTGFCLIIMLTTEGSERIAETGDEFRDTLIRLYFPTASLLIFIGSVSFVLFNILLYFQLIGLLNWWFLVSVPLFIVCIVFFLTSIIKLSNLITSILLLATLILALLRVYEVIEWNWFLISTTLYLLIVYEICFALYLVIKNKKWMIFLIKLYDWLIILGTILLLAFYLDQIESNYEQPFNFTYVLIPIDFYLSVALIVLLVVMLLHCFKSKFKAISYRKFDFDNLQIQ